MILHGIASAFGMSAFSFILVLAQDVAPGSAPGSDVLNYGAVGVLSLAFLYLVYALSKNQIVSRDTAKFEAKQLELTEMALKLAERAQSNDDRLAAIAERQLAWLERGQWVGTRDDA